MPVNMKMHVLIVDDFRTMLQILRSHLIQFGFSNISEATDGQAALNVMEKAKADLIISDWNMEPMSGIDLLRAVRANPNTKDTPVILVTAETKAENVIVAKQAGVSNYIIKPFNAITLKQKMCAVIGQF